MKVRHNFSTFNRFASDLPIILFDSTGVLVSGVEDFESSDDLYDAIGAILHEVSTEKSENDIKDLCEQLLCMMKPQDSTKKNSQKVLDAPINLAQMAANLQINSHDVSSIWVINRDDNLVCTIHSYSHRNNESSFI